VIIGPTMPPPSNSPQPPRRATQLLSAVPMPMRGSQPTLMKREVMKPQAMKAPMLGMTMFDKKVPNLWTWTRVDARSALVSAVVDDTVRSFLL
jgi:hypothetical protein